VPFLQVTVALPATRQLPVQVMLQVPAEHRMSEPSPASTVQLFPSHCTLQLAPQLPAQEEPLSQRNWQLWVLGSQAWKVQSLFAGQTQLVPEQYSGSQAVRPRPSTSARIETCESFALIFNLPIGYR
jgi:hypothetical protein